MYGEKDFLVVTTTIQQFTVASGVYLKDEVKSQFLCLGS